MTKSQQQFQEQHLLSPLEIEKLVKACLHKMDCLQVTNYGFHTKTKNLQLDALISLNRLLATNASFCDELDRNEREQLCDIIRLYRHRIEFPRFGDGWELCQKV